MNKTIALFFAFCLFVAVHAQADSFAFTGVTVISMKGDQVLKNQTVLVDSGRIQEIGNEDQVKIPSGAKRIAAKGKFMVPGFTDAHVHLVSPNELALYLANGVTTVFNLDGRPAHLEWRNRINAGRLDGPTIYSTGPIFFNSLKVEDAVKEVDRQAQAGYEGIKIYNGVGAEEYSAMIGEAKKDHLLLMGHIARAPGYKATLQAGQSVAHMEEFTYTYFNKGSGDFKDIVFDEAKIPALAKETKQSGIFVTPTISTFRDIIRQATDLKTYLTNPELGYAPSWIRDTLQPGVNRYDHYTPEDKQVLEASFAFQKKLVYAFEKAGVPLMTGTDATAIGPMAGFSLHEEMWELVNSGLTPIEALRSATLNPSVYLRREKDYGTIEKGKKADFVLLSGNPLDDIRNTRKIAGVMAHGTWYDSQSLTKMREEIPQKYEKEMSSMVELSQKDPGAFLATLAQVDPMNRLSAGVMAELALKYGIDQWRETMRTLHETNPDQQVISENAINNFGYTLLGKKRISEAIEVFLVNTQNFPKSANTYDSLAEAYAAADQMDKALRFYQKALEVDPKYPNADFARKFLADKQSK